MLAFAIGGVTGWLAHAVARADEDPMAGLDVFAQVLTEVRARHVAPPPQTTLLHRAAAGMVGGLDAHSAFYPPDVWARLSRDAVGEWVGVGADTRAAPLGLEIVAVIPGGPADRAGLRAGDTLVAVDGEPLAPLPVADATDRVRGLEGESAQITFLRGGRETTVAVVRTRVQEPPVSASEPAPGVLLLRVPHFRPTGLATDIARAIAARAPTSVILDLRNNPGGRLEEAAAVADLFLTSGAIVRTAGRGAASEAYDAHADPADYTGPLAVLIDGGSASAAEIVAGALQAHRRAPLIGDRTWGKGSVQTILPLEDGSALKLTIARWELPDGRVIADREGLHADVPAAAEAGRDAALEAALRTLNATR